MTPAFGYPRTASLRQPAEFTALRRQGKRMAARFFQSQYRLTQSADARLGMAVSKRVSKRAVVRNRIRRLIRESFRLNRAKLPPCDVLLIAQTTAAAGVDAVVGVGPVAATGTSPGTAGIAGAGVAVAAGAGTALPSGGLDP